VRLSKSQLATYTDQGFLLLPDWIDSEVIEAVRDEVPALLEQTSEGKVLEQNGRAVRAIHGCHLENNVMRCLTQHPKLLEPAIQMLKSDVYVYQFKINVKVGFDGQPWPWHQDFKHWYEEDDLLEPRAVSVAVYLDTVTVFNGPLFMIPGSHHQSNRPSVEQHNTGWSAKYRADLKYTMDLDTVKQLIEQHGITSTEGPRGSALFFHVSTVHGSASNISPFDRWVLIITYNSVNNLPRQSRGVRPEFLVGRDYTPLVPVPWVHNH
jgi:ectoine hydroxylase-related dioxygenase (phytanoyl-CoA dioxygenase family)